MEKSINIKPQSTQRAQSFLQSSMWGEFKSKFGWTAQSFTLEIEHKSCSLLVLSRKLAPGFSFAYIPWGPEIECSAEELCELARELKQYLSKNIVFVRFDLPWNKGQGTGDRGQGIEKKSHFKKSSIDVQAPDTVVINLTPSSDEILANMKSKWRYNISLATKKGVQVKSYGHEILSLVPCPLSLFYQLLSETAERDSILIHSYDYYKTLFELCGKDSECDIKLYTAAHEGDVLAGIVVLFRGEWAVYLYGASSNNKRNLMAPYALQWQAMQDAKEKGCKYYDLFGIPPNEDPNHPMAGLYRFKTGFGGQIVHRPGCWDYAYKPVFYKLIKLVESGIRKKRELTRIKRINANNNSRKLV